MPKNLKRSSGSRGNRSVERKTLYVNHFAQDIVDILHSGGVGILLTDTIYGIVASALSKNSVERIYKVKGRKDDKPLIVLLSSFNDLSVFGIALSAREKSMVKKVLTASKRPTTVILPVPWKRSEYLHRGTERFRFRIPADGALKRFLKKTGPLVAPSANPEGLPPATDIRGAMEYFADRVDFYVDGGTRRGKPSRLIELLEDGSVNIIRK